jgi:acyl-CoA thioester hydrolase
MLELTITPQFSDTDILGHINYQATVRWFEMGRSLVYRAISPDFPNTTHFLVMVHMGVDYSHEMLLVDDVVVKTRVTKIGRCSFDVEQEAIQNGELCSTGRVVLVYYNLKTRKAEPLPENVKEQICKFMDYV